MVLTRVLAIGIIIICFVIIFFFIIFIADEFNNPLYNLLIDSMNFLMHRASEVLNWVMSFFKS